MVPGQDSLLVEVYTHGGSLLKPRLLHFSNMCWKIKYITEEWQMAKVIPIFANGKNKHDNYRSFSLLNIILETCSSIVNARMKTLLEFYYQRNRMFLKLADHVWIMCL
jgi:hypothetical protein